MSERENRRQEIYPQKKKQKSPFLSVILHYVLPYLLINSCILFLALASPKLQVNDPTEHSGDKSLSVLVHVDSLLPIKNFTAKLEGEELPYTKENKNYIIPIKSNGNLRISVTSLNGMMKIENSQINSFDENPPVIDEDNVVLGSGYLEFTVSDSQSGVDFDSIYGIDKDGNNLKPTQTEEASGKVVFSLKTNSITVYVSDKAGNQISGNFTLEDSPYPKTKADSEEESGEESGMRENNDVKTSTKTETSGSNKSIVKSDSKKETESNAETKSKSSAQPKSKSSTESKSKSSTESISQSNGHTKKTN